MMVIVAVAQPDFADVDVAGQVGGSGHWAVSVEAGVRKSGPDPGFVILGDWRFLSLAQSLEFP